MDLLPPDPWTTTLARLHAAPCPAGVPYPRWTQYQSDAARLAREHGTELRAAGWDELDVFGIPDVAPGTRFVGAGLAWLVDGKRLGVVTAETAQIVQAGGHTTRARRLRADARRQSLVPG